MHKINKLYESAPWEHNKDTMEITACKLRIFYIIYSIVID